MRMYFATASLPQCFANVMNRKFRFETFLNNEMSIQQYDNAVLLPINLSRLLSKCFNSLMNVFKFVFKKTNEDFINFRRNAGLFA